MGEIMRKVHLEAQKSAVVHFQLCRSSCQLWLARSVHIGLQKKDRMVTVGVRRNKDGELS
jgi:hypothetical protein